MVKLLIILLIPVSVFSQRGMMSSGINPDAQTFIVAAGLTSPTQIYATNILTQTTKLIGLWTNMKGFYPMVGGTAATCKWNLKDVRDLDAAYRLTFAASPTFTSDGVDWNGTTQYADTKFISTSFTNTNATLGYYSRENVSEAKYEMGVYDGTNITRLIALFSTNGNTYGDVNSAAGVSTASVVTDTRGLFTVTRTGASANLVYRNATLVASPNATETVRVPTYSIWIAALNNAGTIAASGTKQCAFAFIYDGGMTATEVTNLYNVIQAFQTSLSRQL